MVVSEVRLYHGAGTYSSGLVQGAGSIASLTGGDMPELKQFQSGCSLGSAGLQAARPVQADTPILKLPYHARGRKLLVFRADFNLRILQIHQPTRQAVAIAAMTYRQWLCTMPP